MANLRCVFSFADCEELCGKRNSRKLQNNTQLVRIASDAYAVQLHATNVVTIHNDGTYSVNSGGWETVTTSDRINTYSPARVMMRMGTFWIAAEPGYPNGEYRRIRGVDLLRFQDGMRFRANGALIGCKSPKLAAV